MNKLKILTFLITTIFLTGCTEQTSNPIFLNANHLLNKNNVWTGNNNYIGDVIITNAETLDINNSLVVRAIDNSIVVNISGGVTSANSDIFFDTPVSVGDFVVIDDSGHIHVNGTTGNSTFAGDVRIDGTLFGGSPVKIGGGMNITTGHVFISAGDLHIDGDLVHDKGNVFFSGGNFTINSSNFFGDGSQLTGLTESQIINLQHTTDTNYTDAEAISAIENEATLTFQQPTTISTKSGAGAITLQSVGNSIILDAGIDIRLKDDVLLFDNKKFWMGTSKDYWYEYSTSGSRLLLKSRDIDGGITEGVIFRVLDGTQNVQFLGDIQVDTIDEFTSDVGISIDGVLLKDGLVDEINISASNPHNITKSDIGLEDVDNTSDVDKPISTATQTVLDTKVEGITNSILRKIQLQVANGATPGTNIDITKFTTQGRAYNAPTITDADDLAKSGSSGSYTLSANGGNLILDLSETVTHVLSVGVLSDDLNNGGGGGYYVHTLVISGDIQLMVEKSGSTTNLDWTDVTNTGSDFIIFDVAFITSN